MLDVRIADIFFIFLANCVIFGILKLVSSGKKKSATLEGNLNTVNTAGNGDDLVDED